jgi:hypothetical protein
VWKGPCSVLQVRDTILEHVTVYDEATRSSQRRTTMLRYFPCREDIVARAIMRICVWKGPSCLLESPGARPEALAVALLVNLHEACPVPCPSPCPTSYAAGEGWPPPQVCAAVNGMSAPVHRAG